MKKLFLLPLITVMTLTFAACGGSSSNSSNNKQAPPGSMAGAWDFTSTITGANFTIATEAVLSQNNSGNISAAGSVTANGPSGNIFLVTLTGSSLAAATNVNVDYLGNACGSNDTGTRNMTGTINSSNQVNITFDDGGQSIVITGTLSTSATPPFSGTFKISAPGCPEDGISGSVNGALTSSLAGNYAGTPVGNNSDNIAFTLASGANNSLTGNGTDSVNGPFTLSGTSVGNAFNLTVTPAGGPGITLVGYYDPQLGSMGSALPAVLVGTNANNCPNGATLAGESCLFAIFAKQ